MPFSYDTMGSVRVRGCAGFEIQKNYSVRFAVGERVWIASKAKVGISESVVIKRSRVRIPEEPSYGGYVVVVVYTDTLNRVWVEEELIDIAELQSLLALYEAGRSRRTRTEAGLLGCFPIKKEQCA